MHSLSFAEPASMTLILVETLLCLFLDRVKVHCYDTSLLRWRWPPRLCQSHQLHHTLTMGTGLSDLSHLRCATTDTQKPRWGPSGEPR